MKNTFAKMLFQLRTENGLTQSGLAEKIGSGQRVISKWEKAEIEPNIDMLIEIATFFDCTIDYLVGKEK